VATKTPTPVFNGSSKKQHHQQQQQAQPNGSSETTNHHLAVTIEQPQQEDVIITTTEQDNNSGMWDKIKQEPQLFKKLLGTAGTWFLFDVLFYGNTLFEPIVMEAAFGGGGKDNNVTATLSIDNNHILNDDGYDGGGSFLSDNHNPIPLLLKTTIDSLTLTSIALPGYFVSSIMLGDYQTPKFVMKQGFGMMAVCYLFIGYNWDYLRGSEPVLLVAIYGLTFFFCQLRTQHDHVYSAQLGVFPRRPCHAERDECRVWETRGFHGGIVV